jgi:hypothetical protein
MGSNPLGVKYWKIVTDNLKKRLELGLRFSD